MGFSDLSGVFGSRVDWLQVDGGLSAGNVEEVNGTTIMMSEFSLVAKSNCAFFIIFLLLDRSQVRWEFAKNVLGLLAFFLDLDWNDST